MSGVYEALPDGCIRVLQILAVDEGNFDLVISLHLLHLSESGLYDQFSRDIREHASLGLGDFDALSYTWGPPFSTPHLQQLYAHEHDVLAKLVNPSNDSHTSVKVGRNLYEALIQIWRLGRRRYLWVDALCINQQDFAERARQVKLMSKIYGSAKTVIVWPGVEDPDCPAFADVMYVVQETSALVLQNGAPRFTIPVDSDDNPVGLYVEGSSFSIKASVMRSLIRFVCHRRYFTRAWIMQEVALSTSTIMLMGSRLLPLSELTAMTLLFARSSETLDAFQQHTHEQEQSATVAWRPLYNLVVMMVRRYHWRGINSQIAAPLKGMLKDFYKYTDMKTEWLALLEHNLMMHSRNCTDPRDAIYSLLGYLDALISLQQTPIAVDYEASVKQVYTTVTTLLILNLPHYSILSAVCQRDPDADYTAGLPSWVPDYLNFRRTHCPIQMHLIQSSALDNDLREGENDFANLIENTAGWDGSCPPPCVEDGTLSVFARQAGVIVRTLVGEVIHPATCDFQQSLQAWFDVVLPAINFVVDTGCDLHSSMLKLIIPLSPLLGYKDEADFHQRVRSTILDRMLAASWSIKQCRLDKSISQLETRFFDTLSMLRRLVGMSWVPTCSSLELMAHLGDANDLEDPDRGLIGSDLARQAVIEKGISHVIFLTNDHYLGKISNRVQEGDQLWVICNARVPFVLRPNADGSYHLLGEALVDGAMQGELLHNGIAGTAQRIDIR